MITCSPVKGKCSILFSWRWGACGNSSFGSPAKANRNLRRGTRPEELELVWSASLSLAQLNQPDVTPTILMLLDRAELSKLKYFDRETDPKNPAFRPLNDQEQQRILINTMLGAQHLKVPEVQAKLRELAQSDPSPRVRAAGIEILSK